MNYKAVYRTALATPGLVKIYNKGLGLFVFIFFLTIKKNPLKSNLLRRESGKKSILYF